MVVALDNANYSDKILFPEAKKMYTYD